MGLLWTLGCLAAGYALLRRFPRLNPARDLSFDKVADRLPRILVVCAIVLVAWIGLLIAELRGDAGNRDFDNSWIGLDLIEIGMLVGLARLITRRHIATSPAAAAAATALALDAWFDYMSAAPKLEYLQAMVLAYFVELPLAALLTWFSLRSLAWARTTPRP
ncbi:hypothetical protein ACFRCG_42955 [Embleya sp. NPDC056575]|uniref:hypothetical protein n=1 Tax=unclassified Embleya TaxID=2699296 RepID=UPI0036C8723A